MPSLAAIAALAAAVTLSAGAPPSTDWQQVAEGDIGKLLVDRRSIQAQGDGFTLVYRVDFPSPQTNPKSGKTYASIQVVSTIFCVQRSIVRGDLTAFSGKGGTGEIVGAQKISMMMAKPEPIVKGSSDDDLRRFVCDNKPARRRP